MPIELIDPLFAPPPLPEEPERPEEDPRREPEQPPPLPEEAGKTVDLYV
jgi:hypothetical protein